MRLPTAQQLSLQGYFGRGEGVGAKPNQAMIVRMSKETFDALQNMGSDERMDFEFGDKPGIHIKDSFYPMQSHLEDTPLELYIRTTSSARPNGPLKLSANVLGRFRVNPLLDQASRRLEEKNAAEAVKHKKGGVIVLETPPVGAAAPSRRGPPKNVVRSAAQANKPVVVSHIMPPPAVPSRESYAHLPEAPEPIKSKVAHYLAVASRSYKDALTLYGGSEASQSDRDYVRSALQELAEPEPAPKSAQKSSTTSDDAQLWRLKPQSWLMIRPHACADYTEQEKLSVARRARTWLGNLKVPTSDPAWSHVNYRPSGSNSRPPNASGPSNSASSSRSSAGSSNSRVLSGGVSLKDTREKKAKSKAKPIPEFSAKSEASSKSGPSKDPHPRDPPPPRIIEPLLRVSTAERAALEDKEEGELSATPPLPSSRRLPGSRPTARSQYQATPPASTPSSTPPVTTNAAAKRKAGPVDARSAKREVPQPSGSAKPVPPLPPPAASADRKAQVQTTKIRNAPSPIPSSKAVDRDGERERDRDRPVPASLKRKQQAATEEGELNEDDDIPLVHKRKKLNSSTPRLSTASDTAPNRQRKDNVSVNGAGRDRDHDTVSSTKVKRERERDRDREREREREPALNNGRRSPPPPPRPKQVKKEQTSAPSRPSVSGSTTSSTKVSPSKQTESHSSASVERSSKGSKSLRRRKSPIYTSSEDESISAPPPPTKSSKLSSNSTSTHTSSRTSSTLVAPSVSATRAPSPSDHANLRARYSSKYSEYVSAFQKVVAEKDKIQKMLTKTTGYGGSTDSDGDIEMMGPDELEKLTNRHKSLHKELENIAKVFAPRN